MDTRSDEPGSVSVRWIDRQGLVESLAAARDTTLGLLSHLSDAQWQVPRLPTLNPPLWEFGHVGWFQEYWCLRWRHRREPRGSMLADSDRWFDSRTVAHATRWALDLPSRDEVREYLSDTLEATLDRLASAPDTDDGLYFYRLALAHEWMHHEAFAAAFQTLGYAPHGVPRRPPANGHIRPDRRLPAAHVTLGLAPGSGFLFDNEKHAHPVAVDSVEIGMQPVTNAEYLTFVNDGGYRRRELWCDAGWAWRELEDRTMPRHWVGGTGGRVFARTFDETAPIEIFEPVVHVCAWEAEAYCRWAGKRLPTEAEWVHAATVAPEFDWGRQVWEWTATTFGPFPGFTPDPYAEYSVPWFDTHRVLKGGSFVTPHGLLDPQFRNFYTPDRSDVFCGFRVCTSD